MNLPTDEEQDQLLRILMAHWKDNVVPNVAKDFAKSMFIRLMDAGVEIPTLYLETGKQLGIIPQCFSQVRQ